MSDDERAERPVPATGGAEGQHEEIVRSEEELRVSKEVRTYGTAHLRTEVEEEEVARDVPVEADVVEVIEVEVTDPEADSGRVEETPEGDVSVPVFEERLVVVKRQVVAKRIVLARHRRVVREERVADTVRRERVTVEVDRHPAVAEAEAAALAGEDLSRGPTPRTRHPEGGVDDVADTTEGPTPEIRRVMRATEPGLPHAAGEPAADRSTRGDVAGGQDRTRVDPTERTVHDPDSDAELVDVRREEGPSER
jgi:uncharacterized protein (TIGR02271 family)